MLNYIQDWSIMTHKLPQKHLESLKTAYPYIYNMSHNINDLNTGNML